MYVRRAKDEFHEFNREFILNRIYVREKRETDRFWQYGGVAGIRYRVTYEQCFRDTRRTPYRRRHPARSLISFVRTSYTSRTYNNNNNNNNKYRVCFFLRTRALDWPKNKKNRQYYPIRIQRVENTRRRRITNDVLSGRLKNITTA